MNSEQDVQEDNKVSRSGRVRRKSSKLNDFFESPEESPSKSNKKGNSRHSRKAKIAEITNSESSSDTDEDDDLSDVDLKGVVGFDNQWDELDESSDLLGPSKNDSDEDILRMAETVKRTAYQTQTQMFGSEGKKKSQRKKQNRKDKGKTRLTAYMLWSKHVRGEIVQQNPTMDFSAVNKRLGELWATVPTAQKYNWQNKATKIAVRSEKQSRGSMISTGKRKQVGPKVKGTPGRKPDLKMSTQGQAAPQKPGFQTPKQPKFSLSLADTSPPGVFKVTGTTPIDVAAHLKLLGESLNNIGQKLKEHEGQIAVSGSLSVLLDSMLCVLGPLACLTNEIDVMKDAIPEETRIGILDNIAYIMPGIV